MKPELPILASLRIAVVLIACWPAAGQTPQPSVPATDQSRMVFLNVRVVGADGHARTDVDQDSFRVVEDGIPQKISLFSKAETPITYGLLIDCSGSLRTQLD
jgi:hypothetical protein